MTPLPLKDFIILNQDAIPPYILVIPGDLGGSSNGFSACCLRLRCERERVGALLRVAVGIGGDTYWSAKASIAGGR